MRADLGIGQPETAQGFRILTGLLTLPAGPVAIAFVGETIVALLPSPLGDIAAWAAMIALGYLQWFVATPWIFGRDKPGAPGGSAWFKVLGTTTGELMKLAALGILSALALTGCVSHYAVPTGTPTATLTLAASIDDYPGSWALVQNFADASCAASPTGTRLATFTTKSMQGKSDPHSGIDIQVAAGKPFVFSYVFQRGTAPFTDTIACTMTESLVPTPGARYRAIFQVIGGQCGVSVTRTDGATPAPADGLRHVDPPCADQLDG